MTVISYNREDVELFLYQHDINIDNAEIQIMDVDDTPDRDCLLQRFYFRSNTLPGVFMIMSTKDIVEDIIHQVTSVFVEVKNLYDRVSLFNIEIFNIIGESIMDLDDGGLVFSDHSVQNTMPDGDIDLDGEYKFLNYVRTNDDEYERLMDYLLDTYYGVMRITLEAYIESFVCGITEPYSIN